MFNDLHAGHHVKLPKALRSDFASAVVYGKARQSRMRLCRRDILRRGINARNIPAKPRQRFAQKAGAAPNIQHHFACQGVSRLRITAQMRVDGRPDKAQPNGV
jgi:hypothetical protein